MRLGRIPGKPNWYICWTEEGRSKRESTGFTDRSAADLHFREWQRRRSDPSYAAENQETLDRAIVWFQGSLKDRKIAEGTQEMYRVKLGHLGRLLGTRRLVDLTLVTTREYIEQRRGEGASDNSIHKELIALRGCLKENPHFSRDVSKVIPRFASGYVPRQRAVTAEEAWAVGAHLEANRAAFLYGLFALGARAGEMERSHAEDWGTRQVLIRGTKTEKSFRLTPVLHVFRDFHEQAMRHADGRGSLMFSPWLNMRRDLAAACRRAGVNTFSPNDVRRGAATVLDRAGVPLELIAKFLGHASTAMVFRVYGQKTTEDTAKLIDSHIRWAPGAR